MSAVTTGVQHRSDPSQFSRASRHFSIFQWSDPDGPIFNEIFGTIMKWYVNSLTMRPDKLRQISEICTGEVVDTTIHVYFKILKNIVNITRPLHIFNPRDIGAVMQDINVEGQYIHGPTIIRLWTHEV